MSKPHEESWISFRITQDEQSACGVSVLTGDAPRFAFLSDTLEDLSRADLASAAPDLARALLAVEWQYAMAGPPRCIECDREKPYHWEDCIVGDALKKAGVAP